MTATARVDLRKMTPGQRAVHNRQQMERKIVFKVIEDLTKEGYYMRVFDGEEFAGPRSTDHREIKKHLFSTDEDTLCVYRGPTEPQFGFVSFVYGNNGHDVIHDYAVLLEEDLGAAQALADRLAKESM